ncbi:MAG: hypothetical protein CMO26_23330 [Thiotrichales bacterium]|nr:hypothetical protein [Thiotrichales bacterium]|tara:strand:- start:266 stop:1219 length:954 start_codon:yes stop_codon:yes gene_type:complete
MESRKKIKVGISSCLLGESVRYDGGHKRDDYITDTLTQHFDLIGVCPEVAIGLGVPRPPVQLVETRTGTSVLGVDDPTNDVTARLSRFASRTSVELADVCGYIFKSGSPSCGLQAVPLYAQDGRRLGSSSGVYARVLSAVLPLIPMEQEDRLADPLARESFFERVYALHRWNQQMATGLTAASLVAYHSRLKYQVMAHSQVVYRKLGRLVAAAGGTDLRVRADEYLSTLLDALKTPASRGAHTNVLQHLAGYFRGCVSDESRLELNMLIDRYHLGEVRLSVPLDWIRRHLAHCANLSLYQQSYLEPYPPELLGHTPA